MQRDKATERKSHSQRGEHEATHAMRGQGRPVQRRMQQQQMESSGSASSFAHGEDSAFDNHLHPPQHDRAG